MQATLHAYDAACARCRRVFADKTHDYGTAWRILRPSSLTDQLWIKASRIRTVQETGIQRVADSLDDDFIGLVNYSVMALIQLERGYADSADISPQIAVEWFDGKLAQARELMQRKNHDYGEAWRQMRESSITDLMLQKLLRIKSIEELGGDVRSSEGLSANYLDIVNYAIFVLIKRAESAAASSANDL